MRTPNLAILLACCLLSGCPSSTPSATPTDSAPPPREIKPLTDASRAKLTELGDQFAAALVNSDLTTAASHWNLDGLWDRVVSGITVSEAIRTQAKTAFLSGMRGAGGTPVDDLAGCAVSFRLIHEDPEQGALLLFRAFQTDGSLVYFECLVEDSSAAEPKFIDVYAYANGEFVSRTARRLIAPGLAEASKTPLAKLFSGEASVEVKHESAVIDAMTTLQGGDAKAALAQLEALPAEVRRQKSVLILRRTAVTLLYDPLQEPAPYEEEYLAVLGELKSCLSDDPRAQLMLIDYYLLAAEYPAYHASLETLGKAVGDDAYLGFLHAVGYSREGKHDEAIEAALAAQEQEPELDDVRLGLVDLLVAAERYEDTVTALIDLEDNYGYEFDFSGIDIMRDFLASEEGQAWLNRERGR